MRRLNIFAKGNVDVLDSLCHSRMGGDLVWNGLNEVLRERGVGVVARVRHEPSTGGRGLLYPPAVDSPLAGCAEALEPYPLALQASDALFLTNADAIVLSVLSDVSMRQHRSRDTGAQVYVNHLRGLNGEAAAWLAQTHEHTDLPTVEEAFGNLLEVISRVRARTEAPILIYNVSPVAPGPIAHCFAGLEDSLATRIRRFNLMLVELSEKTAVSIVDVDSVVAKAGADRVKLDFNHLTGEGNRLVAVEVLRVLEDYGLLDA